MKAELYTNCSLVRVPIKAGQDEYYLPQNVEWASRKIDRMVICAPVRACTDPMDGTTAVLNKSDLINCYINLYDENNREIMHDVSVEQILSCNNHPLRVDAKLNLSLCRLYFTEAPEEDGTLLIYVYYQTRTEDNFDVPSRSVTAKFVLEANEEISFRTIIDLYVHALPDRVKWIICWAGQEYPAWITLRDHQLTYQMANIHSELCLPWIANQSVRPTDMQVAPFYLNDLDVDFDNSYIREAAGDGSKQLITFLY